MPISDAQREFVRGHFPALASDLVFLENAGGSQVPLCVANAMRTHLLDRYVQLGAGYTRSQEATRVVDLAHDFVSRWMRGSGGKVILSSSTTTLIHMLASAYTDVLPAGARIVLAETGHEANMGPWRTLSERGFDVRIWKVDPRTFDCPLEALEALLEEGVALVAFPHVSNLLGQIVDVEQITRLCHAHGARVVVDGVAYAPHRRIDCAGWDVDWYVYSTYKVYGPHMAALYGRNDAIAELRGPNHFFIADDDLPYKFELGGPSHEGCAGILALEQYLAAIAEADPTAPLDDAGMQRAADFMAECEDEPTARLVDFVRSHPALRLVGPAHAGRDRVGTVSFVHDSKTSREITEAVDRSGVAIRHGHMYAYDLCRAMGLDPDDGVVRASLVHYNTPAEVDRLCEVLVTAI